MGTQWGHVARALPTPIPRPGGPPAGQFSPQPAARPVQFTIPAALGASDCTHAACTWPCRIKGSLAALRFDRVSANSSFLVTHFVSTQPPFVAFGILPLAALSRVRECISPSVTTLKSSMGRSSSLVITCCPALSNRLTHPPGYLRRQARMPSESGGDSGRAATHRNIRPRRPLVPPSARAIAVMLFC